MLRGNTKFIFGILIGVVIGAGIMYYLQIPYQTGFDSATKINTITLDGSKDFSQFIGQSITSNQFSFEIVDINKQKTGPKGDSGKYFEYLAVLIKIENHGERALSPEPERYYVKDSEGNMYPGEYFSSRKFIQPGIPEEMAFYFKIPANENLKFELLVPVIGKPESLVSVGRVT